MFESIRIFGGLLFSGFVGTIPSVIWALTARHIGSPSIRLGAALLGSALGVAFYFMKATWRASWRNDCSLLVRDEWIPVSTEDCECSLDYEHVNTYLKVPAVPFLVAASFPLLSLSLFSALHSEPLPELLSHATYFSI